MDELAPGLTPEQWRLLTPRERQLLEDYERAGQPVAAEQMRDGLRFTLADESERERRRQLPADADEGLHFDRRVTLRVPGADYGAMRLAAARAGLPLQGWAVEVLRQAAAEDEGPGAGEPPPAA